MQYYQMTNEDINDIMTLGLQATLDSLVSEELLTQEQRDEYGSSHVCLKVDNNNVWKRLLKRLGLVLETKETYCAVVFKSSSPKYKN